MGWCGLFNGRGSGAAIAAISRLDAKETVSVPRPLVARQPIVIPEIDGEKITALQIVADPGKLSVAARQLAGLSRSGSRNVT